MQTLEVLYFLSKNGHEVYKFTNRLAKFVTPIHKRIFPIPFKVSLRYT